MNYYEQFWWIFSGHDLTLFEEIIMDIHFLHCSGRPCLGFYKVHFFLLFLKKCKSQIPKLILKFPKSVPRKDSLTVPPLPLSLRTRFLKFLVHKIDLWIWFFVYFKLGFYCLCSLQNPKIGTHLKTVKITLNIFAVFKNQFCELEISKIKGR